MLSQITTTQTKILDYPVIFEVQPDPEVAPLISQLSLDNSWGKRRAAIQRLGYLRSLEAVPHLLAALPSDPFWMVRCSIIQALQLIGNPEAIPTLQWVAENDSFQVVRSYAAHAIRKLSPENNV
jgi:HEAT repeat protein